MYVFQGKMEGREETTALSFLSFLNPEIPKNTFSGDKCKFQSHSAGLGIFALQKAV